MNFYIIISLNGNNKPDYHAATVKEPPHDLPRKILPIYLSREEAKIVARVYPSTQVLEIRLPAI